MKKSEHSCAVTTCANPAPREYPFCLSCWRDVPKELRKAVRDELAKRQTPDLDRGALYTAVASAAASVQEVNIETEGTRAWQLVYMQWGQPELK